ncbi:MAG: transcription elongation factor Spt5 [Candidatus Altiarchaeota archaeon]
MSEQNTKIYIVKVTTNQEKIVSQLMYEEVIARKKNNESESGIYSILYAPELKGYVLVEAENPGAVDNLARGISHTKGLLLRKKGSLDSAGVITLDELEKILRPTPIVERVNKGDLVELINGPFKGEKARVARIDTTKNQITVELIEATVPIPVIVKAYDIKLIKKEEETEISQKTEEENKEVSHEIEEE